MSSIPELLQAGLAHHRDGRLADAARLYEQVLAQQAAEPDALHLLGLIRLQEGATEPALDLLARAASANPASVSFQLDLGDALREMGRAAEAEAAYGAAVRAGPDNPEALYHHGLALLTLGRAADAVAPLRKAASAAAGNIDAKIALGVALKDTGALEEAENTYREALSLQPRRPDASANLAVVLQKQRRWEEALEAYRDALAAEPRFLRQIALNLSSTGTGRLWHKISDMRAALSDETRR